ncbi:MAG: hypothetical protein ACK5V5_14170 [Cyclobacteriaceae bacterium]|jgi:hypothetical protein|nr:hypothetical protein [Flammeovirgaceae bacterium]
MMKKNEGRMQLIVNGLGSEEFFSLLVAGQLLKLWQSEGLLKAHRPVAKESGASASTNKIRALMAD